jgi:SAM-dependent methyltransferase
VSPAATHWDSQQLDEIAALTLAHYQQRAADFAAGTRDHDVSQNIAALLRHIEAPAPFTILDFGCGPGRDLKSLTALGHVAIGLEGTPAFAAMARADSGCEVWQQDFLKLDMPAERFDGIFANASLFHVPRAELPRVLGELFASLTPGGVLFCSNPRAFEADWEGFKGERYGSYLSVEGWLGLLADAGFTLERHFLRPTGKPPSEQPWLAIVARRPLSSLSSPK